jgi:hypothetical protein
MSEVLEQNALAIAQKNMIAYFETHDVKYVAEDAVFRNLSTGEVYTGRAEIGGMLHFIYHVAFDAKAEMVNHIITEDKALVEGFFKGRHIGEIGGFKATEKEVDVPLCVSYDLKNGLIQEARIYMLTDVMMKQLGVSPQAQKTTYLVRDIFQLKFGHFRDAKKLLDEVLEKELLPENRNARILTDFTGNSYRLILENGFPSLEAYENSLSNSMRADEWQQWYEKFKSHVESSHREILKQVM